MTAFRTKWDDWKISDTPESGTAKADKSPSGSSVSAALTHIRPENGFCQQCGAGIDGDDEFIHSVTGGVRGRLHSRCYWDWFDTNTRRRHPKLIAAI